MLQDAEQFKEEDDLARGELVAKESLKVCMMRTRKELEDIDTNMILKRDRERLEQTLEEVEHWLEKNSIQATSDEFGMKQKEVEAAMNTIMFRINQPRVTSGSTMFTCPLARRPLRMAAFTSTV